MSKTNFIKYVVVLGVLKVGFIGGVLVGGILVFAVHRFSLQRTLGLFDGNELTWFLSILAIGAVSGVLTWLDDWLRSRSKPNRM